MRKTIGFTLVELVVVIVIIGILSVTAAPKLLNLQSDSRKAALQALVGAMHSSSSLVYSKSVILGVERESEPQYILGDQSTGIRVVYGFPTAGAPGIVRAISSLGDSDMWTYGVETPYGGWTLYITFASYNTSGVEEIIGTGCYVTYTQPSTHVDFDHENNGLSIEVGDSSKC